LRCHYRSCDQNANWKSRELQQKFPGEELTQSSEISIFSKKKKKG
jgi:hypothetical protein